MKSLQKILSQISFLIFVAGIYGFLSNTFFENNRNDQEFSLNNIQGIIVKDQYIYIGLGEFSRIQQYSLNGNFVKTWKTNTRGKNFTFKVEGNYPEVLNAHLNRGAFKKNLNLVSEKPELKDLFLNNPEYQQIQNPNFYKDQFGNEYRVSGLFFKSLKKKENGLEKKIFRRQIGI